MTSEDRARLAIRIAEIMEENLYNPVGDNWKVGGIASAADLIADEVLERLGEPVEARSQSR